MTRVQWKEVPREIRKVAEPIFKKWQTLLPLWCDKVWMRYDGDEPGLMTTSVQPEYRQVTLYFGGRFLNQPEDWEETIIHEILHIPFEPVRDVFFDTVNTLSEDAQVLAKEGFRRAMEGMVCDIASGILRTHK